VPLRDPLRDQPLELVDRSAHARKQLPRLRGQPARAIRDAFMQRREGVGGCTELPRAGPRGVRGAADLGAGTGLRGLERLARVRLVRTKEKAVRAGNLAALAAWYIYIYKREYIYIYIYFIFILGGGGEFCL
jgi:hypothetical protein